MKRLNCTVNDKRGVNGDCMEFHERGVYLRYSEASRRIEALVSKYDKQEAKSTKQLELIAKLEERCTPSKVIMIDDTGHYVSEAVHARMTETQGHLASHRRLAANGIYYTEAEWKHAVSMIQTNSYKELEAELIETFEGVIDLGNKGFITDVIKIKSHELIKVIQPNESVLKEANEQIAELKADNKRLKAKVFKSFNKQKPKEGE